MDRYSGKRSLGAVSPANKERSMPLKTLISKGKSKNQTFDTTGCRGRVQSCQDTETGSPDSSKPSPCFRSSKGKEIMDNSCGSSSVMTRSKSSNMGFKVKLTSPLKFEQPESSVAGELEASDAIPSPRRSPARNQFRRSNTLGKVSVSELGSSSASLNIKPPKLFPHKKQWSYDQNFLSGPSSTNSESMKSGRCISDDGRRYGQRNFKCNYVMDSTTQNCGENVTRRKTPEVVHRLDSRGRKETSMDGNITSSTSGIAISGSRRIAFSSGEHISNTTSFGNHRVLNSNTRMRLSCQDNGRTNLPRAWPNVRISRYLDGEMHHNSGFRSPSANITSSGSSIYSISSNDSDTPSIMNCISPEISFDNSTDLESWQHYNMDGIIEVLLALERIERDEELTRELHSLALERIEQDEELTRELHSLEANLFLTGLNLYDEHRGMRMDIDNMSYEELLALEEKMGVVSTALSEEELLTCLRRSTFQASSSEIHTTGSEDDGDERKCSICQEDYEYGDKIGKLVGCQHSYHFVCIDQWLRLKNWCPICKSCAAASQPSSST